MFSPVKDHLFSLIKSLTKAEKRNFKLYANRFQGSGDTKFIQLFDVLDKLTEYDEELLLRRLPEVEKRHLANLKRHLYKQILISLRLIFINKNIDIQIREQLDFARILYGKGMYMQALKLLDRIKQIALEHHQDILHLEILEFEKLIEARHITRSRSVENKMESLLEESLRRSYVTYTTSRLSNLNIQIQGWYIEHGHVRNEDELAEVQAYYASVFPDDLPLEQLTFFEKINYFQSEMWYHYIRLDFEAAGGEAKKWVDLFDTNPQMQDKDPDLYMRGLYYLLMFLFFRREEALFEYYLQEFASFIAQHEESFNANSQMIAFVYLHLSKLNGYFLGGRYSEGLQAAPDIINGIQLYQDQIDTHRILLFQYKIACLYFGAGNYARALDFLNQITLLRTGFLRDDLHFNARILHLICHFELGNFDLLEYFVPSVQRALEKARDVNILQTLTLQFLRELTRTPRHELRPAFQRFRQQIAHLYEARFLEKAVRYLDIPAWVESRIQQKTIEEIGIKKSERLPG